MHTTTEALIMQIKPFIAAAGASACLLLIWPAFAQDTPAATGEPQAEEAQSAMSDPEAAPAMAEQDAPIRNTRPKLERHRDARACLEAGDNLAIIRCANKYR